LIGGPTPTLRRLRTAALVVLLPLLVACAPAPSPSQPAASSPSAAVVATPPAASVTAPPSTLIAVDPSLLDLLPDAVAGHPLEGSPEAAAESAGDATLAANAESLAVAIAADQPTGSFVVASVVQLRPGVYDEEFFRDWRDSFDEGVCAQAGGVSGNAQSEIDGRTVYIGTCAGGVHTYHVYLEAPDAIVSVNSVGEARLGEALMENLPD
jgi:hypothetical protein